MLLALVQSNMPRNSYYYIPSACASEGRQRSSKVALTRVVSRMRPSTYWPDQAPCNSLGSPVEIRLGYGLTKFVHEALDGQGEPPIDDSGNLLHRAWDMSTTTSAGKLQKITPTLAPG